MQKYTRLNEDGSISDEKIEMFYENDLDTLNEKMDARRDEMSYQGYSTERTELQLSDKRQKKLARKLAAKNNGVLLDDVEEQFIFMKEKTQKEKDKAKKARKAAKKARKKNRK